MAVFVKKVKEEDMLNEALHISIVSCAKYIQKNIPTENAALHTVAREAINKIANSVLKYDKDTQTSLEEVLTKVINPTLGKGFNPPIMGVMIINFLLESNYEPTCLVYNKYKQSLLELADILVELETETFKATINILIEILKYKNVNSVVVNNFNTKCLEMEENKVWSVEYKNNTTTSLYLKDTALKIATKTVDNIFMNKEYLNQLDFDFSKDTVKVVNTKSNEHILVYGELYSLVVDNGIERVFKDYEEIMKDRQKVIDEGVGEVYVVNEKGDWSEMYTAPMPEKFNIIINNVKQYETNVNFDTAFDLFNKKSRDFKDEIINNEDKVVRDVELVMIKDGVQFKDYILSLVMEKEQPVVNDNLTVDVEMPKRGENPICKPVDDIKVFKNNKLDKNDKPLNIVLINSNIKVIEFISNNTLMNDLGKSVKQTTNVHLLSTEHSLYSKLKNTTGPYDLIFIEKGAYGKIEESLKVKVKTSDMKCSYLNYISNL